MKALVLSAHGGMECLSYQTEFPDPIAGPGDVVLAVRATSLNYHDIFTRRGMPGIRISMPAIMGIDVAGEIIEIGPEVTGWHIGQRVLVDPADRVKGGLVGETVHGGLAERIRIPAHQLIAIPDGVSYADAACLPCAYGTALRMIETNGQVQAGETVLILGASGGVGVCSLELCKLAGATVIACASTPAKMQALRDLGADHVINYAEQDFMRATHELVGKPRIRGGGGGVDVVVNFTGGDTWTKSLRCLRLGGRLLTCGATAGYDPAEDLRFIWTFELKILGSNGWKREDIHRLLDLVQSGRLRIPVERVYKLEDGIAALAAMEERRFFGKIIVAPDPALVA
jgi:2-desacetyl-2-hydroxyethyl bacteriochlorophyllide A dehydrogenase